MKSTTYALSIIDDCLFVDNSLLETYQTCERAYSYYSLAKRELSAARPALDFGGVLHKILEARYANLGASLDVAREAMFDALADQMMEDPEDIDPDTGLVRPPAFTAVEGDYRNYDTACKFIDKYLERYPDEDFSIAQLPGSDKPFIEVPFALPFVTIDLRGLNYPVRLETGEVVIRPLNKIKIILTGRIDLATIPTKGSLNCRPMDHKSTSMMGPSYWQGFEQSAQFKTYVFAMRQYGYDCSAFIVNGLGVRAPSKTGKAFEFERRTFDITEELVLEWKLNVQQIISKLGTDLIQWAIAREAYPTQEHLALPPRRTINCVGKYGPCQFFNVCGLPITQRSTYLASGDFKDVTWSPLND